MAIALIAAVVRPSAAATSLAPIGPRRTSSSRQMRSVWLMPSRAAVACPMRSIALLSSNSSTVMSCGNPVEAAQSKPSATGYPIPLLLTICRSVAAGGR